MRWLIFLALAGCGSQLADRDAKQACHGFPEGTPAYANCYAEVYQTSRITRLQSTTSMSNTMIWGSAVLLNP